MFRRRRRNTPQLSASELSLFGYCPRAWWLSRVHGPTPADQELLHAGQQAHVRHGLQVTLASLLRKVAYALILLALIGGSLLILAGQVFS